MSMYVSKCAANFVNKPGAMNRQFEMFCCDRELTNASTLVARQDVILHIQRLDGLLLKPSVILIRQFRMMRELCGRLSNWDF